MSSPMPGRIGFVGLGVMGRPMAERLCRAGYDLVVWTRTEKNAQGLLDLGARFARSPAEVAAESGIVLSCLLDTDVIEAVYLGPDGLASTAAVGSVFVEHGTFEPSMARAVAKRLAARGSGFLDAPISGGAERAATGELACMVGGDPTVLDRIRPVLATLASVVEHVGEVGSGLELKLVNQFLVATHVLAAAEAAELVARLKLPARIAEPVLRAGWANSTMLEQCFGRALRRDFSGASATVGGMAEVLDVVASLVRSTGLPTRLFPIVQDAFAQGLDGGHTKDHLASLVDLYTPASESPAP